MKKQQPTKVGTIYVSNRTDGIYLLSSYDLGKCKFTMEANNCLMTITYRRGLTLEQALAIEYEAVGTF